MLKEDEFIGYFDDPKQDTPAFDPGLEAPRPVCLKKIETPMKTISLMRPSDSKSYFFRIHKHCEGTESEKIEWAIIDAEIRP